MVTGAATQKAKRNAVESQLTSDSLRCRYWAALLDTGANEIQSHETMIFNRTSWPSPKKRRLYTLYLAPEGRSAAARAGVDSVGEGDWTARSLWPVPRLAVGSGESSRSAPLMSAGPISLP